MSEQELRIAIVGGRGHQSLIPAVGAGTHSRLVAVAADGCDEAAKEWMNAEAAKGATYYESYEKMLDEVRPDVVSIGSQPACAAPIILAALRRGVQVVSDKPIANSDAELEQIRQLLAANPKLNVLTEFVMRMQAPFLAMREAVRSGKIGEPVLIQGQKSYRFGASRPDYYKSRRTYPGTILFVGSHLIDLGWWVTGVEYAAVQGAVQGNVGRKDYGTFEDHAAVVFKLKNGGAAVMNMDYLRPAAALTHGDDRLRVAGTQGVIEVREDKCTLITHDQRPTELAVGGHDNRKPALELFATLRGKGTGAFSNAESLYLARVLLKAREAADTGKTVSLA